jgi:hypothetical protein
MKNKIEIGSKVRFISGSTNIIGTVKELNVNSTSLIGIRIDGYSDRMTTFVASEKCHLIKN